MDKIELYYSISALEFCEPFIIFGGKKQEFIFGSELVETRSILSLLYFQSVNGLLDLSKILSVSLLSSKPKSDILFCEVLSLFDENNNNSLITKS